jgi:alpha-ketoglutarate-dependent taurine dioxygenase
MRAPVAIGTNPVAGKPVFFDRETRTVNSDSHNRGPLHVDGYMVYGPAYPDFVFLLCARQADAGGESFIVDGYRLLAQLAEDPDERDLLRFLWQTPVEQSSPSGVPVRCPIVGRTPGGRVVIRAHNHQRLRDSELHDAGDQRRLERWQSLLASAADAAPRFRLHAGDFLCLDNYRVFHGREAYEGQDRLLHRIWSWTEAAYGVPDPSIATKNAMADLTVLARAGWPPNWAHA